jgi:hypothetical protein
MTWDDCNNCDKSYWEDFDDDDPDDGDLTCALHEKRCGQIETCEYHDKEEKDGVRCLECKHVKNDYLDYWKCKLRDVSVEPRVREPCELFEGETP